MRDHFSHGVVKLIGRTYSWDMGVREKWVSVGKPGLNLFFFVFVFVFVFSRGGEFGCGLGLWKPRQNPG